MEQEVFEKCLKKYEGELNVSWDTLATQLNCLSGEILRQRFKRARYKKKLESKVGIKNQNVNANILLLDIETAPIVCFTWKLFDTVLRPESVIHDWFILSWSAKWLFDSNIMADVLSSQETKDKDDLRIVLGIWELVNKADIVITHNGNRFDLKKLNTRFAFHKLNPPSHYASIDTFQVSKSNFGFSSNSMNFINGFLGIHQKTETNFDLWKRCYDGEDKALKDLCEYNKNDVSILEELYVRLRPWIKGHPNLALYMDIEDEICPRCGNTDLTMQDYYYTSLNKYRSFRCEQCGGVGRVKKSELSNAKSKILTRC